MEQKRQWHPTLALLPGKSHGQRSLVGCRPWGSEESDTTERLHFHFSLSCIGEGNGNPLRCSCLENPRDGVPGGLPSMGSHRVRHDWRDLAAATAIDGEKAFHKNTTCVHGKTPNKLSTERTYIKAIYDKLIASIILNGENFPCNNRNKKRVSTDITPIQPSTGSPSRAIT